MSFCLMNELEVMNKNTRDDSYSYFQENPNFNGKPLEKITPQDLNISSDNEWRLNPIYFVKKYVDECKNVGKEPSDQDVDEKKCIFRNCILRLDEKDACLVIKDFEEIKFFNAVIFGDLYINLDPSYQGFRRASLYMEHTIVYGNVYVRCFSENSNACLYKCAVDNLFFSGNENFESVSISYSSIGLVEFSTKIKQLNATVSTFEAFRIDDASFDKSHFSACRINWEESLQLKNKNEKWSCIIPCYLYTDSQKRETEDEERKEKRKKIQTLRFFREESSMFSLKDCIKMQVEEQNIYGTRFDRILSKFAQILSYPKWIFGLMLLIIFLFSLFYYFKEENLSFLKSIYHSTITFTTVGYGDCTKSDGSRIASIIESIVGVCCSGAFLIALTRRYLDRKF